MKQTSTPVRIPNSVVEVIRSIAAYKKWSRITAVTELITTSPMYLEHLTNLEKNRETA